MNKYRRILVVTVLLLTLTVGAFAADPPEP
jgi:hypothetical protein